MCIRDSITTYSNEGSEEYVISTELFDDTESLKLYLTEWESPTFIKITDTGFITSKFEDNEGEYGYMNYNIKSIQKTWLHDKTGEITKYSPTYTMKCGAKFNNDKDVMDYIKGKEAA